MRLRILGEAKPKGIGDGRMRLLVQKETAHGADGLFSVPAEDITGLGPHELFALKREQP